MTALQSREGGFDKLDTEFTRLVGTRLPVQLASMPGVNTLDLIVAVADAGGLAMLPTPMMPAVAITQALGTIAERTNGAVGANFLMPFLDSDCVRAAAAGARLVEFFYGKPDADLIEIVHAGDSLASWQVGSVEEARAAETAGCDMIVAQGTEAGGHVRGDRSLVDLLASVRGEVDIPIIAAGGIATAQQVSEAIEAGAAGVRVGTRFIASSESGAHRAHIDAILAAEASDTVLTEAFSVMWPNAPHRVLASSIDAAGKVEGDIVGETELGGQKVPVKKFSIMNPTTETTGHVGAMALYAGESVTDTNEVLPAHEIMAELVRLLPE